MAERVATGEIYISLRDETAAELRRIEQQFDRTMSRIDREEAEVKITGDTRDLERAIAKAERELAALEKERAKASNQQASALTRQINKRKEELDLANKQLEASRKQLEAHKAENKELAIAEKRIAAQMRKEAEQERVRTRAHRKAMQYAREEERVSERRQRNQIRELNLAEKQAYQMERERQQVPKLEAAYVRLHDRIEKLNRARARTRDKVALMRIDVDRDAALAEIDRLRGEIVRRVGRDPVTIPIRGELGDRWGRELRYEIDRAGGHLPSVGAALGTRIGTSMGRRINVGVRDTMDRGLSRVMIEAGAGATRAVGRGLLSGLSRIGHAAGGLADMTVRLGPFTASIRQAFIGLSLLAPMILDVAGAAGALVGSLGAATLGTGALGIAIAGGAIPVLGGMGLVIAGVVKEFSALRTIQKAYDKAILEGNTDLAKDKMKAMQEVMGNVSKETVKQVGLMSKLGDRWNEFTKPARGEVFEAIGEGLQTASDLLPMFAKRTNEGMRVASEGVQKWMQAIRSAEGQRVLDEMMGNFNQALGPALSGLGSLAGYLGRVGAIASRSLPGLARTFRDWAESINDVSESDLEDKVNGVIDSAKTMGRFFMSGGRLIKEFFGAGVDAGDDLIQTMTTAMDRWREGFQTPEGRENLVSFFEESVAGAQSLYNALAPVITSFVNWAQGIAPFARAFFDGAAAVGDFVQQLLALTGLQTPLTALVTTLGSLWALGKIRTATTAVAGFASALTGLGRSQAAVSRAAAAGGARGALGGTIIAPGAAGNIERAGAAAGRAAPKLTGLARVGSIASKGLSGLGAITLGVASPLAGLGVLAAGAAVGIYVLANRTQDWEETISELPKNIAETDQATRNLYDSNLTLAQGMNTAKQATLGVKQAQAQVNQLRRQGKQGSDEYRAATSQLNAALLNQQQYETDTAKIIRQQDKATSNILQRRVDEYEAATEAIEQMNDETAQFTSDETGIDSFGQDIRGVQAAGNVADVYKEIAKYAKSAGVSVEEYVNANDDLIEDENEIIAYADALALVEETSKGLEKATQAAVLQSFNQIRAMKGLGPMAKSAAASMDFLNKKLGSQKTQQIALKFRGAEDATRVANTAARALKNGVPKQVTTRITANSSNADQAVRSLQRAQITPKRLQIIEQGGQRAIQVLQNIVARKLTPKEQRIVEKGGDNVLAKLRQITGTELPTKNQIAKISGDATVLGALKGIISVVFPTKTQNIRESGSSSVLGVLANLASQTLPTITQYINQVVRKVGGNASGRMDGTSETSFVGEGSKWQGAKEYIVDSKTGGVQVAEAPTLMNLTPTQAVIPTEPLYRDRGRSIFQQIARDLGISRFARGKPHGGGGGGGGGGHPSVPSLGDTGSFDGAAFSPTANIDAREPVFKPSKKKKKIYKAQRGWSAYVQNLTDQQGYWEREVSIRESQVREPDEMTVRAPELDKIVVDPITGEQTTIEMFKPNPLIESEYKPDLQNVMKAMDQLMKIITELVRAIPEALAAANQEIAFREGAIKDLNKKIKKEQKKKFGKGKQQQQAQQKSQRDISNWQNTISEHRSVIDTLTGDKRTLGEGRVDAGFDFREAQIAKGELQTEYNTVSEQAQADATEQSTPSSGGSGGGSGSGGISYGQQASLADTEKASVLREFGGNFKPNIGPSSASAAFGDSARGAAVGAIAAVAGGAVAGAVNSAIGGSGGSIAGAGVADLRAAGAAIASGSAAGKAVAGGGSGGGGVSGGGSGATVDNSKVVNVNNVFATVPPDPHTFAKGVEFEVGAAV